MSAAHPLATGSYGPQFATWVDATPGIHPRRTEGLRWWQVLVAYRLLEHDEAGHLVWRNALVTLARQLGKSWLLRALVLWRIQHREIFGDEPQTVIHMAHRLPTAVEVWRPGAVWARSRGWPVRFANGEQCITSPEDGRWFIKASQDGVGVGFSLSMLLVDESWQIARSVVEAADPALAESESPQLLLVSTAGDSMSDLFWHYRSQALDQVDDPVNTLIVEWSAPRSLRLDDPVGWRMANPHWTPRRESEVLDKIGKLDPLEFEQNLLNRWVSLAHGRPAEPGVAVVSETEWDSFGGWHANGIKPTVAAVESWYAQGAAVATGYRLADGTVCLSVRSFPDLAGVGRYLTTLGAGTVVVGKSIAGDPAFVGLDVQPVGSTTLTAVKDLRRYLDDKAFRHDDSPALTEQVLALRTVPSTDGPRLASKVRAEAVKAAVWAVERARQVVEAPAIF